MNFLLINLLLTYFWITLMLGLFFPMSFAVHVASSELCTRVMLEVLKQLHKG